MDARRNGYAAVSAAVFALVAIAQLTRAIIGVPVEINHWLVPGPMSVAAGVFAGVLAVWGWRSR